ncbi:hypothetical protein OJAV_G00027640 [Oryzias javanicus]|uniref:Right handed beta helix domain-containing protein n=1 Tax=Oryzias javanicus TaxID=123683 RepID=A0A3S2N661_ORYJA|nr:hypothetical protein OJAV_G00027640 [Oryzias javanicus]
MLDQSRAVGLSKTPFWSGLVLTRSFPGVQIYDGPIRVHNCTFRNYVALDGRHSSALGFRLNNSWQSCPNNNVSSIRFDHVPMSSRVFFGEPGPWFSQMHLDGDKTTVFHDVDGSVSEFPGAFLSSRTTGFCATRTAWTSPTGKLPSAAAATPRSTSRSGTLPA